MRIGEIVLRNKKKVAINYSSKRKCPTCGKNIWNALIVKSEKNLIVELVSLALWDLHECKKENYINFSKQLEHNKKR